MLKNYLKRKKYADEKRKRNKGKEEGDERAERKRKRRRTEGINREPQRIKLKGEPKNIKVFSSSFFLCSFSRFFLFSFFRVIWFFFFTKSVCDSIFSFIVSEWDLSDFDNTEIGNHHSESSPFSF